MLAVIELLNSISTTLFGWLMIPFRNLSPLWPLTLVSVLAGALMLWIFGKVSDQESIRKIRDRIRSSLLGVRLYQHDIAVVLRLQKAILTDTLRYLRYSLVPILILVVPVLLILAQLNLYFSARPVAPGASVLLKVKLAESGSVEIPRLETPPGVLQETPPVRIPSQQEVAWRLRPQEAGRHELRILYEHETAQMSLRAGGGWDRVPTLATRSGMDLLLYPGEPVPPAPISAVEVSYPALEMKLLGWDVHWLVWFLVISLVAAFALKKPMGVEF